MKFKNKASLFLTLFGIGFTLNAVWELVQMSYFSVPAEPGYFYSILYCLGASVIDGVTIVFIFIVLERIIGYGNRSYYLVAGILGAVSAVLFEWIALKAGLWAYDQDMPIVPILRIGAIPFLQLMILVPVSIYMANKLKERKSCY